MDKYKTPGVIIEERNTATSAATKMTLPADISDIVLELRAASGYNATNNTWQDKSNTNNLVNLSAGCYKSVNGIYFDGLTEGTLNKPLTLSGDYTIYLTIKPEVMGKTILGDNGAYHYGFHYLSDGFYTAPGNLYGKIDVSPSVQAFSPDNQYKVAIVRTFSDGVCSLYINGSYTGTFSGIHQSQFTILRIAGEIIVGQNNFYFKGSMNSLIIYKVAHDAGKVNTVTAGI